MRLDYEFALKKVSEALENIFLNVWKVCGHGVAVIPVNRVNVFVKSACFFVFKPGIYVLTIVHILASPVL
jgi:hypothetical protein